MKTRFGKQKRYFQVPDTGFTVIEMLLVVLIIGILAAVSLPAYDGMKERSYRSAVEAAAKDALSAGTSDFLQNEDYVDNVAAMSDEQISISVVNPAAVSRSSDICVEAEWIESDDGISFEAGNKCDVIRDAPPAPIAPTPVTPNPLPPPLPPEPEQVQSVIDMTWRIDSSRDNGLNLSLPISGNLSGEVDWGDGITTPLTSNNPSHTYSSPGEYTVRVLGNFSTLGAAGSRHNQGLISVENWENSNVTNASFAFAQSPDLVSVSPPPPTVTNMSYMFDGATSYNQSMNSWNASNVTNMGHMFNGASSFNQDISSWSTGNVTSMTYMFSNASSFNRTLFFWNVSNVRDMSFMFRGANSYNQSMNFWNTSNVTDMRSMFQSASSFNQNITQWDVSNVDPSGNWLYFRLASPLSTANTPEKFR